MGVTRQLPPLLVTLANTGEILYTDNRPGNRPSHDGCFDYLDPAVDLAHSAGFKKVRLRGDGHFSLTDDFDYWSKKKVEFVFGLPAHPKLVKIAERLEEGEWRQLQRDRRSTGKARGPKKLRVKQAVIEARGYKNLELEQEGYTEFTYRPRKCSRDYRVVVLRKTINVRQGQAFLIPEIRYHFYITNVASARNALEPARRTPIGRATSHFERPKDLAVGCAAARSSMDAGLRSRAGPDAKRGRVSRNG